MTWFAVGAAVVGVAGSVYSSNKAADGQQSAADQASQISQDQYAQTRNDNLPALQARNGALAQMQNLATQYGSNVPTAASVMAQPGYQFGLDQGANALQGSAAAAGGLYSGATGKALTQYGTDYATTKYDDAFNQQQAAQTAAFNRQASISGQGQTGANTIATAGQNNANAQGGYLTSNANAQGAAAISQGNTLQNGLNQVGSSLNSWYSQPSTPYNQYNQSTGTYAPNPGTNGGGGISTGGSGYNPAADSAGYWADGGPVRTEPKVGTYGPAHGATGGGLSDNALMTMLAAQDRPAQPQRSGVGALPTNPLMNPQGILAARMQQAGAYSKGGPVRPSIRGPVRGPGGPRSDSIPVRLPNGGMGHLSNGEHVVDTAAVNAIGGGSNSAGQMKLNRLRMMVKGAH